MHCLRATRAVVTEAMANLHSAMRPAYRVSWKIRSRQTPLPWILRHPSPRY